MLTGYVPFKGNSPLNVYLKHMREQPVAPSVLNLTIPPEVEQVVLRALAKNPEERYQTAQDFNTAYQHALVQANARQLARAEVVTSLFSTRLPSPQIRLVKTGDLHQSDESQPRQATLPRRRKQERGIAMTIVALALLLLLMLSFSPGNTQQTLPTQLIIQSRLHDNESLTPTRTPIPPPPPPIVTGQQNGEGPSDNANSENTPHQGNHNKQDDHVNNENKSDWSHHKG
jgi:serine/threonine protein kinase